MGFEPGEFLIDRRDQFVEIRGATVEIAYAVRVAAQGAGDLHFNRHDYTSTGAEISSAFSRYVSNALILGAIGSSASKRFISASVVFKPLPVMHKTVVSSAEMRVCS